MEGKPHLQGAFVQEPIELQGGIYRGQHWRFETEFLAPSGGTLRSPLARDLHNNATGDFVSSARGGVYQLATSSTSGADSGQLTFAEFLPLNLNQGGYIEARVKCNYAGSALASGERLVFGVCSGHANAEDSLDNVTVNAWFRLEGTSTEILIESDDGTTDNDDVQTGFVLVDDTWATLRIDWGVLSAVRFYVNGNVAGELSMADLDGASNPCQLIFCIQRDSGTTVEQYQLDQVDLAGGR